jgi:hypothetical protein
MLRSRSSIRSLLVAHFNWDKQAERVSQALQGVNKEFENIAKRAHRHFQRLEAELSAARYPGLHLRSLLRPLCGDVTAEQITWCHDDVFVRGAGPWPQQEFKQFLNDIGFTVSDELGPETTVLLGCHGLEREDLQPLIDYASDQELQILPQELFILGLIRREDPFELLNDEQIALVAEGHRAIRVLLQHEITWPVWISTGEATYEVPVPLTGDDIRAGGEYAQLDTSDWSDRSVLGNIGYSVRDGLLTIQERRTYLETALTHDLTDVASPTEMDKWGAPGTTARLQALVSFVLWLNHTQSADKPAARQKRLDDLRWLKDRYDPSTTRIQWPALSEAAIVPQARKRNEHFMRPLQPSPQLAVIVGSELLPKTEVVSKLWSYIKRNRLQDSVNKRIVNTDENLRAIFDGKHQVTMFEMAGLIGKHLK